MFFPPAHCARCRSGSKSRSPLTQKRLGPAAAAQLFSVCFFTGVLCNLPVPSSLCLRFTSERASLISRAFARGHARAHINTRARHAPSPTPSTLLVALLAQRPRSLLWQTSHLLILKKKALASIESSTCIASVCFTYEAVAHCVCVFPAGPATCLNGRAVLRR